MWDENYDTPAADTTTTDGDFEDVDTKDIAVSDPTTIGDLPAIDAGTIENTGNVWGGSP